MDRKTYYEVRKAEKDELSAEFLSDREAENWALDLERRGWATVIYKVERDSAVDHTKKVDA